MRKNSKTIKYSNTLIFRYRTMESLFKSKDRQELMNSYIYLSRFDDLNDPLDGYIDLEFEGDKNLWKNLFEHFIYSYFSVVNVGLHSISIKKKIEIEKLLGLLFDSYLLHDVTDEKINSKNLCNDILNCKLVDRLINKYSERKVSLDELYEGLLVLHDHMLKSEAEKEGSTVITILDLYNNVIKDNKKVSFKLIEMYGFFLHEKYQSQDFSKISHISTFFPSYYKKFLKKLMVYNHPRVACFSNNPLSLPMWGYYAGSSTGACLIFKLEHKNGKDFLPLSVKSNPNEDSFDAYEIYDIDYKKYFKKISFFKSLGASLPPNDLKNYWYKNAEKSKYISFDLDLEEKCFEEVEKILSTKKSDWKHEEERRLFDWYGNTFLHPENIERLYYSIESLYGVIFGINSSFSDIQEIISILEKKAKGLKKGSQINLYMVEYEQSNLSKHQFGVIDKNGARYILDKQQS